MARKPIDATGPTDWNRRPELRKLRSRITPKLPTKTFKRSEESIKPIYAKAIGVSLEEAENKIARHREVPTGYTVRFPHVDATGPTEWSKAKATLRKRIQAAIQRRMYGGGPVDPLALKRFAKGLSA